MSDPTPILSAHGITRSYQNGDAVAQVPHDVSLDVRQGEFLVLLDESERLERRRSRSRHASLRGVDVTGMATAHTRSGRARSRIGMPEDHQSMALGQDMSRRRTLCARPCESQIGLLVSPQGCHKLRIGIGRGLRLAAKGDATRTREGRVGMACLMYSRQACHHERRLGRCARRLALRARLRLAQRRVDVAKSRTHRSSLTPFLTA